MPTPRGTDLGVAHSPTPTSLCIGTCAADQASVMWGFGQHRCCELGGRGGGGVVWGLRANAWDGHGRPAVRAGERYGRWWVPWPAATVEFAAPALHD